MDAPDKWPRNILSLMAPDLPIDLPGIKNVEHSYENKQKKS